jgi:hypothetical protein
VDNYYEYLRTFSQELGARIVERYPPLQGPNDPLPIALETLLRQPLPAQALTISGVAKHLKKARSAIIVGECGTGKTLMSVAVAHAVAHTHSEGRQYTAIGMCPPHLLFKWAREVLETIPYARTFIIYDLRNGGDPTRPHGVVEVIAMVRLLREDHSLNRKLPNFRLGRMAITRPEPKIFSASLDSVHWPVVVENSKS